MKILDKNMRTLDPPRILMLMISELHKLGYQKIRLYPHFAGAGYWRYVISAAARPSNRNHDDAAKDTVWNSLGDGESFEWAKVLDHTIEEHVQIFLSRYPAIARQGFGEDKEYTDWYSNLMKKTAPNGYFTLWIDSYDEPRKYISVYSCKNVRIPYPPGYVKKYPECNVPIWL